MPIYRKMKSIVVLFAERNSKFMFDKVFGGKSAFDLSLEWADSLNGTAVSPCACFVFASPRNSALCGGNISGRNVSVIVEERWTNLTLARRLRDCAADSGADTIIFSFADCPFLDLPLTLRLAETHGSFCAEYTFCDGYPYGFAPEVLDAGAASVLAGILSGTYKETGAAEAGRDGIYGLVRTDINSFEVETVLAPSDWRLLRFDFSCSSKDGLLSCMALMECSGGRRTPAAYAEAAAAAPGILKTVPGFYNIQICEKCPAGCGFCPYPKCFAAGHGIPPSAASGIMPKERLFSVISQISALSDRAVVGLSAWGEPLEHPDIIEIIEEILSYDGLSVFIETDGLKVTEEFCSEVKAVLSRVPERTGKWPALMFVVSLDSVSPEKYSEMHGHGGFEAAVDAVRRLEDAVPGCVYPQMVRTCGNECELEKFFRLWKDRQGPSHGNLIIQKYDGFCGLLPDSRPADLSPLERGVCWHLRRDMTILCDGSVPVCREFMLDGSAGNVFTDGVAEVWKRTDGLLRDHIAGKFDGKCGNCDEYYTFNF